MSEIIVKSHHLKGTPRLCIRGAREWCRRNGIDFMRFMRDGVPASTLEATGDALALVAVQRAREEAEANRGT